MKMKRIFVAVLFVLAVGTIALPTWGAAPAKPIILKWTTFEPDVPAATQESLRRMGKLISEQTEGRVQLKIYWGSVLGKAPDFLKMVGGPGVADGGFIVPTYNQWEIPLFAAGGLPFLTKGHRVGPLATWELYNEWPAMQAEMKKVNVKPLWVYQPHEHWSGTVNPIKSIDEMKGKKVWAAGFWQEMAKALGMVNVPMVAPEAYDALQKGLIEGIIGMPYHTFRIFKYTETLKYLVEWPYGGQPVCTHVINLDVWKKISPKDQRIIEKISAGMHDWFVEEVDKEALKLKEYYKSQGVKEIRLSSEEYERMGKIGKDAVWSSWLKTAKEKGVPGEEWFRRYQDKVKKFSKQQ